MGNITPDERVYKQLLPQFREKESEDVWYSMHSYPQEAAYKLAGERVLAERAETTVQLRARWALYVSIVAVVLSAAALAVSYAKLLHDTALLSAPPPAQTTTAQKAKSASSSSPPLPQPALVSPAAVSSSPASTAATPAVTGSTALPTTKP